MVVCIQAKLIRRVDPIGLTGTGHVADIVLFLNESDDSDAPALLTFRALRPQDATTTLTTRNKILKYQCAPAPGDDEPSSEIVYFSEEEAHGTPSWDLELFIQATRLQPLVFLKGESELPKTTNVTLGHLHRNTDMSGFTGTGDVALVVMLDHNVALLTFHSKNPANPLDTTTIVTTVDKINQFQCAPDKKTNRPTSVLISDHQGWDTDLLAPTWNIDRMMEATNGGQPLVWT
jgi:hypothetical protein